MGQSDVLLAFNCSVTHFWLSGHAFVTGVHVTTLWYGTLYFMPSLPGKHFVFHLIVKQNNTVLVLTLSYTLTHLLVAPISIQIVTGQAAPSKLSFVAIVSLPLVMTTV